MRNRQIWRNGEVWKGSRVLEFMNKINITDTYLQLTFTDFCIHEPIVFTCRFSLHGILGNFSFLLKNFHVSYQIICIFIKDIPASGSHWLPTEAVLFCSLTFYPLWPPVYNSQFICRNINCSVLKTPEISLLTAERTFPPCSDCT